VHPRVVAPEIPASDEEQLPVRGTWRGQQLGLDAGEVPDEHLRREVEAGLLVIPSTISISGALIQSWYGAPLPVAPDNGGWR